MKITEIQKWLKETTLPDKIVLSNAVTIVDLNVFFDSHMKVMLNKNNSDKIRKIHYDRVMDAIKIIKCEDTDSPELEVEDEVIVEEENVLEVPQSDEPKTGLQPNEDFENETETIYEEKKVEPKKEEPPKPQPKKEKKPEPKKNTNPPSNDGQISMF